MQTDPEALLARMRELRGYVLPAHEVLAERDPDFLDGYDRMFRAANSDASPLPADVRELLVMALDIVVGVHPDAIRAHAGKAISHGATEAQVVAAVELAVIVQASKTMGALGSILRTDDDDA
jgi:alkylhydroperoxidase/carboxymuconolactone decarboxylase family protein YurZ